MKVLALVLLVALVGCEGEVILDCARACNHQEAGKRMLRYSSTEGCICEDGEKRQ